MDKWLFKWTYSHLLRLYYDRATALRLRTYQMVSAICRLWADMSKKTRRNQLNRCCRLCSYTSVQVSMVSRKSCLISIL